MYSEEVDMGESVMKHVRGKLLMEVQSTTGCRYANTQKRTKPATNAPLEEDAFCHGGHHFKTRAISLFCRYVCRDRCSFHVLLFFVFFLECAIIRHHIPFLLSRSSLPSTTPFSFNHVQEVVLS